MPVPQNLVITRGNFPTAATRALRMAFLQEPSDMDRLRTRFFQTMTSDQAYEIFLRGGGFGLWALKPEGDFAVADTATQMYEQRIYMRTYGKEIAITLEARQDDPKGVFKKIWDAGSQLRNTMEYTLELLHWSWVNDNWTDVTADPVFTYQGTGYALGNLANPTQKAGTTYPNRLANPMQFNRANLQTLYQLFCTDLLNEQGLKQGWKPVHMLVGNADSIQAEYVLASKNIAESADNGPNVVGQKIRDFIAPLLFRDDGAWGLYTDLAMSKMGLLTFNRAGMDIEDLAMDATLNTRKAMYFRTGYGGVHNKGLYVVPGA